MAFRTDTTQLALRNEESVSGDEGLYIPVTVVPSTADTMYFKVTGPEEGPCFLTCERGRTFYLIHGNGGRLQITDAPSSPDTEWQYRVFLDDE
jgi:hypothetical protein